MQTNCNAFFWNKINTVLLISVDLLVKSDQYKKEGSDRDIGENEENEKFTRPRLKT